MDVKQRLYTPAQVARIYGVNVVTVKAWLRKGIIGHVIIGPTKHRRIPEDEARRHFVVRPGAPG